MARFILDVGNLNNSVEFMETLVKTEVFNGYSSEINCIDDSNENQLYNYCEYDGSNFLSVSQLQKFSNIIDDNLEGEGNGGAKSFENLMIWNNFMVWGLLQEYAEENEVGILEISKIAIDLMIEFETSEYIKLDKSHTESILLFLNSKGFVSNKLLKTYL